MVLVSAAVGLTVSVLERFTMKRRYAIYEKSRKTWDYVVTIVAPSLDAAARQWIETRPTKPFRVNLVTKR